MARLVQAIGLDGAALVQEAATPAAKERVRQQTDEALAHGVFGVPTVEVNGEVFWGCDAFPDVEDSLLGQDPVQPEQLLRWANLPAAAQR